MATKKKKKFWVILLSLIVGAAVFAFKNPNLRKWVSATGAPIGNTPEYKMGWSLFSNKITLPGRTDIVGTLSKGRIDWVYSNGTAPTYWTAA